MKRGECDDVEVTFLTKYFELFNVPKQGAFISSLVTIAVIDNLTVEISRNHQSRALLQCLPHLMLTAFDLAVARCFIFSIATYSKCSISLCVIGKLYSKFTFCIEKLPC